MTASDTTINLAPSTPADSPSTPPPLCADLSTNNDQISSKPPHLPQPTSNSSNLPTQENSRRKRRKTRPFEVATTTSHRRFSTGAQGVKGRGIKFADIPNIAYMIDKSTPNDIEIQFLHRLLFNSLGATHKRKSDIRAFSGYIFVNDHERTKIHDKILRCRVNVLKRVVTLLDIEVDFNLNRDCIANTIINFLEDPKPVQGHMNLAIKEKLLKAERQRKRLQKAKNLKEAKRKQALLTAKQLKSDSEEDGDIDLETNGKTWIEIAEEASEIEASILKEEFLIDADTETEHNKTIES